MKVRPEDAAGDPVAGVKHMVVIVPVDADVHETQHVAQEHRQQRQQRIDRLTVRDLHLQHHDGDDDGDHPVAECFEPSLAHARYPLYADRAAVWPAAQRLPVVRSRAFWSHETGAAIGSKAMPATW